MFRLADNIDASRITPAALLAIIAADQVYSKADFYLEIVSVKDCEVELNTHKLKDKTVLSLAADLRYRLGCGYVVEPQPSTIKITVLKPDAMPERPRLDPNLALAERHRIVREIVDYNQRMARLNPAAMITQDEVARILQEGVK